MTFRDDRLALREELTARDHELRAARDELALVRGLHERALATAERAGADTASARRGSALLHAALDRSTHLATLALGLALGAGSERESAGVRFALLAGPALGFALLARLTRYAPSAQRLASACAGAVGSALLTLAFFALVWPAL